MMIDTEMIAETEIEEGQEADKKIFCNAICCFRLLSIFIYAIK